MLSFPQVLTHRQTPKHFPQADKNAFPHAFMRPLVGQYLWKLTDFHKRANIRLWKIDFQRRTIRMTASGNHLHPTKKRCQPPAAGEHTSSPAIHTSSLPGSGNREEATTLRPCRRVKEAAVTKEATAQRRPPSPRRPLSPRNRSHLLPILTCSKPRCCTRPAARR
uniref:Uncharacterized protein n=1 Tax=Arundo donax TaxID=35708 RepID=A0A0A8ZIW9_ARUDO